MIFGFALLGALVILLPGFAGYYGLRIGEASNLVSPFPDRPNSNQTVFFVVLFALLAHAAGTALFAANEAIAASAVLLVLPFDPNPYAAFWSGHLATRSPSIALFWELCWFVALTFATSAVATVAARRGLTAGWSSSLRFGWLQPMASRIEAGSHVVIGYVLTRLCHEGAWIAYEGVVRRLSLGDDDAIEMIVLEEADRFVVRIVDGRIERVDSEGEAIALIQLSGDQVANYALELIEITA